MKKTKERAKGFVFGVLFMALLTPIVLAANPGGVMREVFYDVNLVVNGTPWNPPADMMPFISDGRTFLPVRGIAELLDVPVDWDGATRTVFVGTIPHGAPLFATVPAFQTTGSASNLGTVNMLGNAYPNSLRSNSRPSSLTSNYAWYFNLNGQFNQITGLVGSIDGQNGSGTSTISFIGDGRTLGTFSIDRDSRPTEISVDVTGVLVLRILVNQPGDAGPWAARAGTWLAFTDAMIH